MPSEPAAPSAKDLGWIAVSALPPALLAASQLEPYGDGGRDNGVIRTAGLGFTGGFRALDGWVAAACAALPLGTRTFRAELPGVVLVGLTAALTFVILRRTLTAIGGPSVWSPVLGTVATATLTFSYPFQHEAVSPASNLLGVVLVLAALAWKPPSLADPRVPGLVTLGLSYEPLVGALILVGLGGRAWAARRAGNRRDALTVSSVAGLVVGGAFGLAPFGLAALGARINPASTGAPLFAGGGVSPGELAGIHALGLVRSELGEVLVLLAAIGFVWALVRARTHTHAREQSVPLATLGTAATVALVVCGSEREAWTTVGLVSLFAVVAFAGVAMQEGVLRVARARLPLASASAAMVVLLEAAFPAITLDDELARTGSRPLLALPTWEDTALSGLPSGTLILASAPHLYARFLAARVSGRFPGDLTALPTFDPKNEASARALAHDSTLVPLFRDLALVGVPQELSLSTLATARPLAVATDPRWDRSLTRHLVPQGLLVLFEPEPRGGADRKRALAASSTLRARLSKILPSPFEPALTGLTVAILLDRALAAVQTSEREVALQALSDTAAFAPNDARIAKLMFKETNAPGPVDVHELVHEGLAGSTLP